MAAVTVGGLLILFGGSQGLDAVSQGELTTPHGEIDSCAGCHVASAAGPRKWLQIALTTPVETDDSKLCLTCHQLGDQSLNPHSLDSATLAELTRTGEPTSRQGTEPLVVRLADRTVSPRRNDDGTLTCGTCHKEHHGRNYDLTAMSNAQCQSCHTVQFASLGNGHPELVTFPYSRRTRLIFDHVKHIGRHFTESSFKDKAPTACKDCHQTDASGKAMLVKAFEQACAGCHEAQILGEGRAGSAAVPVLRVPGLDVASLREQDVPIGEWPELAEDFPTPFMDFLMSSDEGYVSAMAALADADPLDLVDATDAHIEAAESLAWSVKEFLFEILVEGVPALSRRIDAASDDAVDQRVVSRLMGALSVDALRSAQQLWFPNLLTEVSRHRAGQRVSMPDEEDDEAGDADAAPTSAGATDDAGGSDSILGDDKDSILATDSSDILTKDSSDILATDSSDILTKDSSDILSTDSSDILTEDSSDILATDSSDILTKDSSDILSTGSSDETSPDSAKPADVAAESLEPPLEGPELVSDSEWSIGGGWYVEDFSLVYRPVGHADAFLKAWLEFVGIVDPRPSDGAARRLFAALSDTKAVGYCGKCHSIDGKSDDVLKVNWQPYHPVGGRQTFTKYDHESHFALIDSVKGCTQCHTLYSEAPYLAAFESTDPSQFTPGFNPSRETCAACHAEGQAGDTCITCHNYHIGTFPPAIVGGPMSMEKAVVAPGAAAKGAGG